jgi:hypothetical protein
VNPRSEPLLWLQLVALGAIPLELLLLLLLLAGADPGPLPALERAFVWGIGVLAPGVLLWRRPADCGSLLLVQVPVAGRSPLLRHLNALQQGWPPRMLLPFGGVLLLATLWIVDARAALAGPLSPLDGSSRLVTLILAVPLLALLLWQWQQLGQALWLLSRSPQRVEEIGGKDATGGDSSLLSLGLPILMLPALHGRAPSAERSGEAERSVEAERSGETDQPPIAPEPHETEHPPASAVTVTDGATPTAAVTVKPEQTSEEEKGDTLNEQVD